MFKQGGKKMNMKFLVIVAILISVFAFSVSAGADVTYNYYDNVTKQQVTNVETIAYLCYDQDCNSVSLMPYAKDETFNTNTLTLHIGTISSPRIYAVYHYAKGYVPIETKLEAWGDRQGSFNKYFTKIAECRSTIDHFIVVNNATPYVPVIVNVSASLDAKVWSAFTGLNNGVGYVPEDKKQEYYSALTIVNLTITNSTKNIVYSDDALLNIFMSGSEDVSFTWTPKEEGRYVVKVETNVVDPVCKTSLPLSSMQGVDVLAKAPWNECYTLLNNLHLSHEKPTLGNEYKIYFDKTSASANENYALTSLPTKLILTIKDVKTGAVVHTDTISAPANKDYKVPEEYSFSWTPKTVSDYTVMVSGQALTCPYIKNPIKWVSEDIFVDKKANTHPMIDNLPSQKLKRNQYPTFRLDLRDYTTDIETSKDLLQYSVIAQTKQELINCKVVDSFYLTCERPALDKSGVNEVTIQVSDGELLGTDSLSVSIANSAPVADFAMPSKANVLETVNFDGSLSSDPDSDDLTYSWSIGGVKKLGKSVSHTFSSQGTYDVTLTVSDNEFISTKTKQIIVSDSLSILSINCFDPVIVDGYQSCSVFIDAIKPENKADVKLTIYYEDGSIFGSCNTNALTGGCSVEKLMTVPGIFTVYATAEKQGVDSDLTKQKKFTFRVFAHRYDISELGLYKDIETTKQSTEFYRGDNLYLKFKVLDLNQNNIEVNNILTNATLKSPITGGFVQMNEYNTNNADSYYYYKLEPIPATHQFKGQSYVFIFAYNFADNSGGERNITILIKNNLPVISGIDNITLTNLSRFELDLSNKGTDKEDQNNLTWSISGTDLSLYDAVIENNKLVIMPKAYGSDVFTLSLKDLDNDYTEKDINLKILGVMPIANAGGPYTGKINVPLTFDASLSTDDVGIVKYYWDFNDGTPIVESVNPKITHTYTLGKTYSVKLTVADKDGNTAEDTTSAIISSQIPTYSKPQSIHTPDYTIKIEQIRFMGTENIKPGEDIMLRISIENNGDKELKGIRIFAGVMELGSAYARAGPFSLDVGEKVTKTITIKMPDGVRENDYTLRISATDRDGKMNRATYRKIRVRSE